MATYFVTGVSGALGSRVVSRIAARAGTERVIGVDSKPLSASSPKLQFVSQTLAEDDLAGWMEGADVLLHLAGSSEPRYFRALLEAAAEVGVKQVVFASSATVFGAWPTNPVPLAEDAPLRPNPGFTYATRLAECERILSEWRSEHDKTPVVILRMAMMLGGGLEKALNAALGGVAVHRELHSSRPVQFLHIDDAVEAITMALDAPLEGTFNVAPRGFVGDAAAREIAGSGPRPGLPRELAWIINDFVFRKKYRANYAATRPYLQYPWVISSDRLIQAGWTPSYSTEEALVSEAEPTWWGGLRPGQRRSLVSGGVVGTVVGTFLMLTGSMVYVARWRWRKSLR